MDERLAKILSKLENYEIGEVLESFFTIKDFDTAKELAKVIKESILSVAALTKFDVNYLNKVIDSYVGSLSNGEVDVVVGTIVGDGGQIEGKIEGLIEEQNEGPVEEDIRVFEPVVSSLDDSESEVFNNVEPSAAQVLASPTMQSIISAFSGEPENLTKLVLNGVLYNVGAPAPIIETYKLRSVYYLPATTLPTGTTSTPPAGFYELTDDAFVSTLGSAAGGWNLSIPNEGGIDYTHIYHGFTSSASSSFWLPKGTRIWRHNTSTAGNLFLSYFR